MMGVSVCERSVDRLLSLVLCAAVLLSWGFVIYGARVAAQRQLERSSAQHA